MKTPMQELLEWVEKHSDFTPTTSYGEGYKIALTDIISHLTQPKEGEIKTEKAKQLLTSKE